MNQIDSYEDRKVKEFEPYAESCAAAERIAWLRDLLHQHRLLLAAEIDEETIVYDDGVSRCVSDSMKGADHQYRCCYKKGYNAGLTHASQIVKGEEK